MKQKPSLTKSKSDNTIWILKDILEQMEVDVIDNLSDKTLVEVFWITVCQDVYNQFYQTLKKSLPKRILELKKEGLSVLSNERIDVCYCQCY